jgi:putative membrane-bound dehydrogenase-like protein
MAPYMASGATPNELLSSFTLHPDFQIEVVAMEPQVFDPVDMRFDERGRMYVMEMSGYPFPDVPGRVVQLSDADGDGFYETRQVFAEGSAMAVSLMPYREGLLVASPPDILYLKDTDGDGVADVRETILTGFEVENPQHNTNAVQYGLDNWIYVANGGNSGAPEWPGKPESRLPLRFDDFRFQLPTHRMERVGRSAGGFEITADAWGRWYGTHNLHHIRQLVFPGRYIVDTPQPGSGTRYNVSDHDKNGMARIFPTGVQETRVNHPEQSGYFSGACGITYYGGGAFPDGFNDNVFVCDVVLNLIHRDIIAPNGTVMKASRGREGVEFLTSTDRGFRPVNMTVGPDGALYVLDMHRTIIEHPEWIPDELEANMDLDEGKKQGRIYRITPKGGLKWKQPSFSRKDPAGTVAYLEHPNAWWRMTAQRLLVEWHDAGAVAPLSKLLADSDNPLARTHALWTLDGIGALRDEQVVEALSDSHARVREQAVKLAEPRLSASSSLLTAVAALATDPDPRVRLQTALTLGTAGGDGAEGAITAIAERDLADPWTRLALLSTVGTQPLPLFRVALSKPSLASTDAGRAVLRSLAEIAGREKESADIESMLTQANSVADESASTATAVLAGLADGLGVETSRNETVSASKTIGRRLDHALSNADPTLVHAAWRVSDVLGRKHNADQKRWLREARKAAVNRDAPLEERLAMLDLLAFDTYENAGGILFGLLDTREPGVIQAAAIEKLAAYRERDVAQRLIAVWDTLGPRTRTQAGNILLYQRGNNDLLLTALENETLSLGELNLHLERRRVLLHSRAPGIRQRAEKLFTDAGVVTRKDALEKMRPALALMGDPVEGRAVFEETCIKCHRMGSEGVDLGPNLTEIYRKSPETLLHDIVDPNAGVNAEYMAYTIETTKGDLLSGIVVKDTAAAVTLREAQGIETAIPREDIEEMYSGGLSLMPEELEVDMPVQTMADLLAYLQQPK